MSEEVSAATASTEAAAATTGQTGTTDVTAQDSTATETTSITQANTFLESLPEDLRAIADLKEFQGADSLAKAFVDLKAKFQAPEKPEGYEYKPGEGEKPITKEMLAAFQKTAHSAGMNGEQFQQVVGWWNKMVANEAQNRTVMMKSEITKLEQEWGNQTKPNLEVAKKAFRQFATDEEVKFMEATGLGNSPAILKLFHRIGTSISEGKFIEGARNVAKPKGAAKSLYPGLK